MEKSDKPIVLCGRTFRPELVEHLNLLQRQDPDISNSVFARVVCELLAWRSPNGRLAVSSARVALVKLRKKGLLPNPRKRVGSRPHRLRASGNPLPPVDRVPARVDLVKGLHLHLISGCKDPLHLTWNDLIIEQHPCGDAPMVGCQLRYLIGSDHGWLGAIGLGPAAFVLGARDHWVGWSTAARLSHLNEVVGLARFLIRQEVHCTNLASKVLSLVLSRLPQDWQSRYGVTPLLVETFVDRTRFSGRCFSAANWRRVGASTGRGRLGPQVKTTTTKDVWVYQLDPQVRTRLRQETMPPITPCPLLLSLEHESWCADEMKWLDLGDVRLNRRAVKVLSARWTQPQASFYGSFENWADAKGAYQLIENKCALVSMEGLLGSHRLATQERMAAQGVVLLPQDTTSLNFSGLKQTTGLGSLGEGNGRGLWLHSMLAYTPDGIPLGLLDAHCWARPDTTTGKDQRGRNAKSIDEKEKSMRWITMARTAASAALRMPQTQLINIADREGDIFELYEDTLNSPPNLHALIRLQHNRNLNSHQKLRAFMRLQQPGGTLQILVPRQHGQKARQASVEIRWAEVDIKAPQVGCKKNWPPLRLSAVWVHEPNPPSQADPLDWLLLTDMPVTTSQEAWQKVHWYQIRWGIEEWHRVLKTGCNAEGREFKTASHLKRVLAFDLIVAWRVLACLKLGRVFPGLPASLLYHDDELAVLAAVSKKNTSFSWPQLHLA